MFTANPKVAITLLAISSCGPALGHDFVPTEIFVNPPSQSADRDNAKLTFLEKRARRSGVSEASIQAARGTYYALYLWQKSDLRVCFWNGTDVQQMDVMKLADSWIQSVPSMRLIFQDEKGLKKCTFDQLKEPKTMADIRISLDANDPRQLWSPEDIPNKRGDWSYPGRAVSQLKIYPTTMNLAGALAMKANGLITAYNFNVRHEFGHALGLVHEHQRSVCEGWFNIKAIAASQNWTEELARSQVGSLGNTSNQYGFVGAYDVESIMQYNFAPSWYVPDRPNAKNPCRRRDEVDDLSKMDRATIAQLYEPALNETPERRALLAAQRDLGKIQIASISPAMAIAAPEARNSIEKALEQFSKNIGTPQKIAIQVFPHPQDRDIVLKAVANLGYPLQDRTGKVIRSVSSHPTPFLQGDPTNAVLYTADVSDQDVRFVALGLLSAGIEIKSIQRYWPAIQNNFTERDHLIQVGSSQWNRTRRPLAAEDILTKRLPIYGLPQ